MVEKNKIYYICVLITVLLSYGFALTHFSIGIDDEYFEMYFKNGGLVAQGRVQGYVIGKILDLYEYMPVWREIAGIILMMVGLMLIGNLFYKLSKGRFHIVSETIFACIAISFPDIANTFIFSMTVIGLGLDVCFPAMKFQYPKCFYLFFLQ